MYECGWEGGTVMSPIGYSSLQDAVIHSTPFELRESSVVLSTLWKQQEKSVICCVGNVTLSGQALSEDSKQQGRRWLSVGYWNIHGGHGLLLGEREELQRGKRDVGSQWHLLARDHDKFPLLVIILIRTLTEMSIKLTEPCVSVYLCLSVCVFVCCGGVTLGMPWGMGLVCVKALSELLSELGHCSVTWYF